MHETIGGSPVLAIVIVLIIIIVAGGIYLTARSRSNFDPAAECRSIGGQYDANSGTCTSGGNIDPTSACAGIGGVYNIATGECNAPVVQPDPVNPALACQDIGGQYDTTTGQCLSGPIPPDPRQSCVDAGGVYNATTQDCIPAVDILDTEEECRSAGRIWDGQTFECITEVEASARCVQLGGHWNIASSQCTYCTTGQSYNTQTGTCVNQAPINPEAECIAAGNVWNAQDQACYLSESRTAELEAAMAPACYDAGMTIDFSLGNPGSSPPYCVSCNTKYPGSVWNIEQRACVEAGAQPVALQQSIIESYAYAPEIDAYRISSRGGFTEVQVGVITQEGTLTSVVMNTLGAEQGWGNYCSNFGFTIKRDGATNDIATGAKRIMQEAGQPRPPGMSFNPFTLDVVYDSSTEALTPVDVFTGDKVFIWARAWWDGCHTKIKNTTLELNLE